MALTISNVTTAVSTTSGATLALTGITAAVGDTLILACAADNAGAAGVSSTSATITDTAGNTWPRQSETNRTQAAAANDGTTLSIWTSTLAFALSSATLTLNFSPDTTAKAAVLYKVVPGTNEKVVISTVGPGVTGSGIAFSSGAVSVNLGQTIFGFTALENNLAASGDPDTTNGSWSTAQTAVASLTALTSQSLTAQWKTVTAGGSQSYDTSVGVARDFALNYLIVTAATAVVDQTLAALTAAATGTLALKGALGATLGAVASSATGTLALKGALAGNLAPATLAATSSVPVQATLAATLAPLGATMAGTAAVPLLPAASIRILCEITWPDGQVTRLWDGSGPVLDADGELWRGAIISKGLDALEQSLNGEAWTLSMTLSGVPGDAADTAWMSYSEGNIVGAAVRLLIQPCDAHDMPVWDPEVKFTGTIDNVLFDDIASDTGVVTSITVEVTNRFALRRVISGRVLSDTDQKARSAILNPGAPPDLFCEFVPLMQDKTITWPRFN